MTLSLPIVILLRLPAPIIVIALWVLSAQSTLPVKGVFGLDKLLHFAAFGALSAACGLWFSRESWLNKLPRRNLLVCMAFTSVYGALDEFHQYFVPGRAASVWDWIADTIGGAAGAAAFLLAARFWERQFCSG